MVRLPEETLAMLDAWIAAQPDAPSRPQAIRQFTQLGLASTKPKPKAKR